MVDLSIAMSVYPRVAPISLWFMVFITIVTGVYKPTNITGGATL